MADKPPITITQPQDRIYRKPPKPPTRTVVMQLPADLVERIEAMAARQHMRFHSAIYAGLYWACAEHGPKSKPRARTRIHVLPTRVQ